MSRKSKRSQGPSLSQSQSQSQRTSTLTQQTLDETFGELNIDIEDNVNNLVRYIISRAGNHLLLKQTEIKKNVLPKTGTKYQEIIDRTARVLKYVYGYNLIVADASAPAASREYIITNSLPYINDPTIDGNEEIPEDSHKVLLLLILSHIFLSNDIASEMSLYAFLKSLKIDVERRHEIFGNVRDYIHHNLKIKKYLKIEVDQISKKSSFSWGPRAEKEISKHDVLKFVCKIYNDRLPNSWINQFKAAEDQNFENHKELTE